MTAMHQTSCAQEILVQGNYSEKDQRNWTPELKKALHFDQTRAMQSDNGMDIAVFVCGMHSSS